MSENVSLSSGTEIGTAFGTALLSQRDLAIQIPINFKTEPAVSLSAACFAFNTYVDDNTADCLSNLMAVGFRRFEIDLYWDQERNVWSFCPVAIPSSINPTSQPSQTTQITSDGSPTSTTESTTTQNTVLGVRQDASSLSVLSSTALPSITMMTAPVNSAASSSGQGVSSVLPSIDDPKTPLISIGPYTCATSFNVSTFISQVNDYLSNTDNNIAAHLMLIVVNIHAAASAASPLSGPAAPINLPDGDTLLGNIFRSDPISNQLYTPQNLAGNRANVNDSWYKVAEIYSPADGYYNLTLNEYGQASTEDGWPSESYIGFSKGKRLLVGWGTVDSQMAGYNFSADADAIFPSDSIKKPVNVNASPSGVVTSGCFLRNNTDIVEIWNVNSSWAETSSVPGFNYPTTSSADITPLLNLTANITSCGISSVLNYTLLNVTAHQDFRPYQAYSHATIWSWGDVEPRNSSDPNYRCALTSSQRLGRWMVADCTQRYYAACRASYQPYNWTTSSSTVSYSAGSAACPSGYSFAAPRTALENSFLTQAMRAGGRNDTWVDFNALDVNSCWVTGGPKAECPYKDDAYNQDYIQKKIILVPTIAAVITLVIAALTIFVKAAGNRKTRKRTRKRADNGFVYEGVPS